MSADAAVIDRRYSSRSGNACGENSDPRAELGWRCRSGHPRHEGGSRTFYAGRNHAAGAAVGCRTVHVRAFY